MVRKIISYGGGTNSTAMIIGLQKQGMVPDHILFADTGGERQATYSYISYFSKWLKQNGMPEIEIVKYKTKDGIELTLEQDIINNNTLPAIAFGFKSCSDKFKIRPQSKFINERYKGDEIVHYIGYDIGESRRVKDNPLKNHTNLYPLIEWGWDRPRCVEEILLSKLCLPGKSSCFFCPSMKKPEILTLSDDEKERVKFIESNAKNKVELKGLGRQYAWTDLINTHEKDNPQFEDVELFQTPCECID